MNEYLYMKNIYTLFKGNTFLASVIVVGTISIFSIFFLGIDAQKNILRLIKGQASLGDLVTQDKGWYSFAKDSDNSRIADSNLTLPLKLKWTKSFEGYSSRNQESADYAFGPYFLARDEKIFSVNHTRENMMYRESFNYLTGESLWKDINGPHSVDKIYSINKDDVLVEEYLHGASGHGGVSSIEADAGINATLPPGHGFWPSNVDTDNSIAVIQGMTGTDASSYMTYIFDYSQQVGAHPVIEGKLGGGFRFERHDSHYFYKYSTDYIDLGKRANPYDKIDLNDNLNPKNQDWSVMLWFKWDGVLGAKGTGEPNYLFNKGGSYYGGLAGTTTARLVNGSLEYRLGVIYDYVKVGDAFKCSSNEWCHLAITFDHKYERVYKNGELVFKRIAAHSAKYPATYQTDQMRTELLNRFLSDTEIHDYILTFQSSSYGSGQILLDDVLLQANDKSFSDRLLDLISDMEKGIGSNNESFTIGGIGRGNWHYGFSGWLDEFAIFNKALPDSEIASVYDKEITPDASTIALMHFNNDSAKGENNEFVYDFTGLGNNGKSVWRHFPNYLWKTGYNAILYDQFFAGAQPIIHNGVIYLNDGKIYAHNERTGDILWQKGYNASDLKTRNINAGEITYSRGVSSLLDPDITWTYSNSILYTYGFEVTNNSPMHHKIDVIGYDNSGNETVKIDVTDILDLQDYYSPTSIIIKDGIAYVKFIGYPAVLNQKNNETIVAAIELATKKVKWANRYSDAISYTRNSIQHMVVSGNLLFVSLPDRVIALDINTDTALWTFKNSYSTGIDSGFSGLIVYNNMLYLGGNDGRIFAFEMGNDNTPLAITNTEISASADAGSLFTHTFVIEGGVGPYNWRVSSGNLPSGIVLKNQPGESYGVIEGIANETGIYNFTLRVTDNAGNFSEKTFMLIVGDSWIGTGDNRNWYGIAMSADGLRQTAVADNNYIYISLDYGQTWMPKNTNMARSWRGVAMSADGAIQTAITNNDNIYVSYDYGESWTSKESKRSWNAIAMSADGKWQTAASTNGGKIYISSNYGDTWVEKNLTGSWTSIAMSSDGSRQTAVANWGTIYTSTDYGATWNPAKHNMSGLSWQSIAMSSDGSKQTAVADYGQIYVSSDYGNNWTVKETQRRWRDIAMSSNGAYQTVVNYGGKIYKSSDFGNTWIETEQNRNWQSIAMSADGSIQSAVVSNGQIYVSRQQNTPVTKHTITASAGAHGSISPTGEVSVNEGASQSFSITPSSGYHIADVLVDGISIDAVATHTFNNVLANHNISATFEKDAVIESPIPSPTPIPTTYTIIPSATAGGSISPSANVLVNEGSNQSFTITPDSGYHILDVKADNVSVGAVSSYEFKNVKEAHSISASFEKDITYYSLTIASQNGAVSKTPDSSNYAQSAEVNLQANPDSGYHFVNWTGDAQSTDNPIKVVMDSNKNIVANFERNDLSVSLSSNPTSGEAPLKDVSLSAVVSGSASGTVNYTFYCDRDDSGTDITTGYVVKQDNKSETTFTADKVCNYNNPGIYSAKVIAERGGLSSQARATITVSAIKTHTITASFGTHGSIAPTGVVSVNEGSNQSFTITPDSGYHILDVKVDDKSEGAISSYEFKNVKEAHSISASFEKDDVVESPNPPVESPIPTPSPVNDCKDLSNTNKYKPTATNLNLEYDKTKDISNLADFLIQKTNTAEIFFLEILNLIHTDNDGCYQPINIDNATTISLNKVKIDSTAYPELNRKARIKFYNITASNPKIMKDGVVCIAPDCTIISYDKINHILIVEVKGF